MQDGPLCLVNYIFEMVGAIKSQNYAPDDTIINSGGQAFCACVRSWAISWAGSDEINIFLRWE